MRRFSKLIGNEFIKMFSRPATYIMLALIPALTLGFGFIMKISSQPNQYFFNPQESELQYQIDNMTLLCSEYEKENIEYYDPNFIDGNKEVKSYWFEGYENYITPVFTKAQISGQIEILSDMLDEKYDFSITNWKFDALLRINEFKNAYAEDEQQRSVYDEYATRFENSFSNNDCSLYLDTLIKASEQMQKDVSSLELYKKYDVEPIITRIYHDREEIKNNWKYSLIDNYNQMNSQVEWGGLSNEKLSQYKDEMQVIEHRLKNNLPEIDDTSLFGFMLSASSLSSIIAIFIIIISATMMASEYSSGTVKLLMISPFKRWKLFFAKLVAILLMAIAMLAVLFVSSYIIGGIFFGFDSIGSWIFMTGKVPTVIGMTLSVIVAYISKIPFLLVLTSLSIMLAVITRRSSFSIGIGVALLLGGSFVTQILSLLDWDINRFVLFFNSEIATLYLPALSPDASSIVLWNDFSNRLSGMNIWFSLGVLAIYTICFIYIGLDSFNRRDIKQS